MPLSPTRSIFPASRFSDLASVSYTAKRMLDEPALIVSTQGDADFTSQVLTSNRHDSIFQSLRHGTVAVVCGAFVVIMAHRDGGMICRWLRHVLHVLMQVQTDWGSRS